MKLNNKNAWLCYRMFSLTETVHTIKFNTFIKYENLQKQHIHDLIILT